MVMDDVLKILVVDDDDIDRMAVRRALRAAPWKVEVSEARDAAEAVTLLKEGAFDCALMDYQLPGRDGLDVLREVRNAGVRTPVIMLTGQGNEQVAVDLMKAGASDYLTKGQLSLDHLTQSVRNAVRVYRAESAAALAGAMVRESENRFRTMADSAPVLLWVTDTTGQCIYLNAGWLKFTGRTMEQELGQGWTEGIHAEDRAQCAGIYWEHFASRTPFEMEYRLRRWDGGYRWVLDRGVPRFLSDGSFAGYIGSCLDITERQQIEEQRVQLLQREQAARAQAEAANRAKDQFLAVLSHELRTPLTPVLSIVSALEAEGGLSADVRGQLEMIRRNVELEARLIDDLLDLTRIAKGKLQLNLEVTDAHAVARRAVEIWRTEIDAKRLQVDFELHAAHSVVRADSARLQQVFWNLLKNAVKFTPAGGRIVVSSRNEKVPPDMQSRDLPSADLQPPDLRSADLQSGERQSAGGAQSSDDAAAEAGSLSPSSTRHPAPSRTATVSPESRPSLIVSFTDTGIGIQSELLPRIFDAFEQGEGVASRQFGGLGLGLAISRALVEAHGGRVSAASEGPGRGATFSVQLPTIAAAAGQSEKPALPHRSTQKPAARILLVDDHADTSRAMKRLLQRLGYDIETADSVRAALDQARGRRFDLLISDIGLPDGSGLDLMREIQGVQKIRGIALSGFGMEDDVRRSKEAGFEEHLTKPVNFQRLESVIRQLTH
jgi:PAS domain S-box-containing protein